MEASSCAAAWREMTEIAARQSVRNFVQVLDMSDYVVETDVFPKAALVDDDQKLSATVFFRAQAASIFPKNIHFIGSLMDEVARRLPNDPRLGTRVLSGDGARLRPRLGISRPRGAAIRESVFFSFEGGWSHRNSSHSRVSW